MRKGKQEWDYGGDEVLEVDLGFDGYEEERMQSTPQFIGESLKHEGAVDSPISPYVASVFTPGRQRPPNSKAVQRLAFAEIEMQDMAGGSQDTLAVEEEEEWEPELEQSLWSRLTGLWRSGSSKSSARGGGMLSSVWACVLCKPKLLPRTVLLKGEAAGSKASRKELKKRRAERGWGGVAEGTGEATSFPRNKTCNQKYNMISFLPLCLYEQFKYFCNLYFLAIALSQFIPQLQVGYLFTYIAPLAFVVLLSLAKEAVDDFKRFLRDRSMNRTRYRRLVATEEGGASVQEVLASDIQPGHLIRIEKDERVPADVVVLRTTEESGGVFIRTDQLDGETDWKLRRAVSCTQELDTDGDLFSLDAEVFAEKPNQEIYTFIGTFTRYLGESDSLGQEGKFKGQQLVEEEAEKATSGPVIDSLSLENTMWANTVLAAGSVIGLVVYTGAETRSSMNVTHPSSKTGILDSEVNTLAKVLCAMLVLLAVVMVAIDLFRGSWWLNLFRFVVLFSAIIPISMRVNLDLAKLLYSYLMANDEHIEGTIVRNTAIPEELGRISYFLTDKTGTLTQNDMIFKKLHLGTLSFTHDSIGDISELVQEAYVQMSPDSGEGIQAMTSSLKNRNFLRKTVAAQVRDIVLALALCHNVTPVIEEDGDEITYQASSPDEVALVKFTESVGLTLIDRTFDTITLRTPQPGFHFESAARGHGGGSEVYDILECFPFTSERKRMGIIVRSVETGEIQLLMKGADVVMKKIVEENDWLEEECGNLAREGLRTLVFGRKVLTEGEFERFMKDLQQARTALEGREEEVEEVMEQLERGLELIGLSGVEDKLQQHVKSTLETLRNAGIKIWMLTGDKIETATCIAVSSKLVSRAHTIFTMVVDSERVARAKLEEFQQLRDSVLVIDGKSLQICLERMEKLFFEATKSAPSVVCCRCSPTQKADVVNLMRRYTDRQTCAIGDGGNDVSMIQAAHVGVGIEGKEGKQASLAADFSITQFSHVARLLLWHGRNSYQRSARLSQFIIHRGLIISFIQAIFSAMFYMATVAIYTGMIMVGYSTWYTMAPVFALVLDEDVTEEQVFLYPELYTELQKGRVLSIKTFVLWTLLSTYQASVIMVLSILLFEDNMINIVAITFTALILSELINVSIEIQHWKLVIVLVEIITFAIYFLSMLLLPTYFDLAFIATFAFWWKMILVTLCSVMPPYLFKVIRRKINPPRWQKLAE